MKAVLTRMAKMLLKDEPSTTKFSLYCSEVNTYDAAQEALFQLLPQEERRLAQIELRHDCFGAPMAKITSRILTIAPLVSLSDEEKLSVCFALLPVKGSHIVGVGIDIADIDDAKSFLEGCPSANSTFLFQEERAYLNALPESRRVLVLARLLSTKESAFKSMSAVFRKMELESRKELLGVSVKDFGFAGGRTEYGQMDVRGISGVICSEKKLKICVASLIQGRAVFSIAVCKKDLELDGAGG